MASSREITHTERRIDEVDALAQTIERLQAELRAYSEALRQELTWLQQAAAEPEVEPEPAELPPTVTPMTAARYFENMEDDDEPLPTEASSAPEPLQAAAEDDALGRPSPFELDDPEFGEERIGGKPVSVIISDGSISTEPLSGWVIDRPTGGLKLLVDDEFKVGTVIGVRPSRESPHAMWINVSVKSIKPERQSFILTCHFIERPPWNALQLLNG